MSFTCHHSRAICIVAFAALTFVCSGSGLITRHAAAGQEASTLIPTQLSCEHSKNPLGVDVPSPRLSWKLKSPERGERQTAYRILVASTEKSLKKDRGDLWDSSKVASEETLYIPYSGQPLHSSQRIFWKVFVWDKDDKPSGWSTPATWTMGLLNLADWRASWISAKDALGAVGPRKAETDESADAYETVLARKEFKVSRRLVRAVIHVCGLGHYEMTLNGSRIGADLFMPGWTKYDKTCTYDTYDITDLLHKGLNSVGLFLGNGFYNVRGGRYIKFVGSFGPLKAIAMVRLEYANGTTEVVGTDSSWRVHGGPITFSCVYGGEDYDARLEPAGWTQTKFDDASWDGAVVVPGPGGTMKGFSSSAPPVRAIETLKPVNIRPLKPGVAVYDFGQNAPLMPRLAVRGPASSSVKLIPSELINADGSVDRVSCGGGQAYWKYTLSGRGMERYFSKFFYHGCRYLQVECLPAADGGPLPLVDSLEGVVVHSSSAPIGEFACSNELFNRIRTLVRWAQRANMMSLLTDCPHREKLGWLEEYHLNGPSLRYEWDLAQLFTKTMNDMADSQLENGLVPDIAPEYTVFQGGFRDSPEWGSAFIVVPWQQYEWTDDLGLIRRHYEGMKRYIDYLASKAQADIVSHGLGDWYDIGPKPPGEAQLTPKAVTATAFYYYDTWILARAAALLGHPEEAKAYEQRAAEIREAFNKSFFDPAADRYATGSQTANAIPLVMGLIEPEHQAAVLDVIVKDVQGRGNALTSGDVGYRYLLRALAEGGRSDVIFDMNNQSDKPGYGYQLQKGATSLTEAWDAGRASSQNHFMLGHIMEWFYRDLAGLGIDPAEPGFKKIIINPQPAGDVTWARARFDSVRGLIASEWKIEAGAFTLSLTIPPNTTAVVNIPAKDAGAVTENGQPASQSPGVRFLRHEKGRAVYEVGSGHYMFRAPWN